MKRILAILAVSTLPVLFAVTIVSFAQQQRQPAVEPNVIIQHRVLQTDGPPPPPPPGGDFVFVASEIGFGGKLVKGAAYSAEAVTETIQTLSDGNRIINKISSAVFRDSEGRTRREQTFKGLGNLGDSGEQIQTIFINDPVAGVSYALDSRTHIAHKSMPFKLETGTMRALPGGPLPERQFEYRVEPSNSGNVGYAVKKNSVVVASSAGQTSVGPEAGTFTVTTDGTGGSSYVFTRKKSGPDPNEVTEQLGKQVIEGVEAEGTRTTITIPAGDIGNERPLEIVSERWYSPELQVVVMSRHSDPRSGETTYRLTNINRTEPARSLFEVPPDYTVKEGMPGPPAVIAPTKARKPANPE